MKRGLPYIIGAIVLIAVVLLLIFQKPQRKFDGRITLNPTHSIPYGSYVAYQLMQQQFPNAKLSINKAAPGEWKLPTKDSSGQALFILLPYFDPTPEDLNSLIAFAQKGNTIFISALQMSDKAQLFFRVTENDLYSTDFLSHYGNSIDVSDSFTVRLDSSIFAKPTSFSYPGVAYNNRFLKYDSIYAYPLGYNKKVENLLAIHTLKGTIFLHSAPITFSNLFLLWNNNHLYFEKLMSLLPSDTKFVMWDEYFLHRKPADDNNSHSILYVLLKYENFRWAFWLSIVLLLLYILTEVKRRQRLTPEHTPPANDTLAFVSTIGKLYFEKGDHKNLADKLSVYFLDFIRNKYQISTTEINADFAKAVAIKSNVSLEEITTITDRLINIKLSDSITQEQLMEYHQLLEHFYSKT